MAASILSAKRLREILDYNPETGVFTWKVMLAHRRKPGDVAGGLTHGYIEIGIENHSYRAHHLAWLYIHGELPQGMIDHIDGNRVNNAIANLRIATNQQNSQNKRQTSPTKVSCKLLGVTWNIDRQCWQAQIGHNGKNYYLGLYKTDTAAHAAYLKAKRRLHEFGEIAKGALEIPAPERIGFQGDNPMRGTFYDKRRRKWCARISINGQYKSLGSFVTQEEAAEACRSARNAAKAESGMQGIETASPADNLEGAAQ